MAKVKNREADQAAPGPLDGMRDKLSPEEIEEKIQHDRDMKRILWAVGAYRDLLRSALAHSAILAVSGIGWSSFIGSCPVGDALASHAIGPCQRAG